MVAVMLTVQEIAGQLKVHPMTVYRLIHAGTLPAVKVGRSYRVSEVQFRTYLREARTRGARPGEGSGSAA